MATRISENILPDLPRKLSLRVKVIEHALSPDFNPQHQKKILIVFVFVFFFFFLNCLLSNLPTDRAILKALYREFA